MVVLCVEGYAGNLLREDFDYSGLLTEHGWYTTYGNASAFSTTNGLEFDGYAGCNVGNAAVLDMRSSDQLHLSFSQVSSGDVYVAFMMQPTIVAKDGYFFCLRDEVSTTTFNFNARIWINTDMQIGLTFANNDNKVFNEDLELQQDKNYLVVIKYSIKAGANNDEVSLYVLDSFRATEPATATVGPLKDTGKVDINPMNVVLRGFDDDSWIVVDGIRVGTSWGDAVEAGSCEAGIGEVKEESKVPFAEGGVLHFELTGRNRVRVCDILGRVIVDEELHRGRHSIELAKGIYLLKLGDETNKVLVK